MTRGIVAAASILSAVVVGFAAAGLMIRPSFAQSFDDFSGSGLETPTAPAQQRSPSRTSPERVTGDVRSDRTTRARIRLGRPMTGTIETAGDVDWFGVQLSSGEIYEISLEGAPTQQGSLPDPFLYVYSSQGQELATNDDGGTGYNALLVFRAPSTGLFYLAAGAYANTIGSYTLAIEEFVAPHGDSPADRSTDSRTSVGAVANGSVGFTGDEDWFAIELRAGIAYTFDLEGQPTGAGTLSDPMISIHDRQGRELARDDDGGHGLNARLTFTPRRSATYYLSAEGYGPATGTYRLRSRSGR